MATGIIGAYHVFHTLFLDSVNEAQAVTSPTIDIFYFNTEEEKVELVSGVALTSTGETGRYIYAYLVPGTLQHGMTIYAEMWGVEPDEGLRVLATESLSLVSQTSVGGTMVSRFVRGG